LALGASGAIPPEDNQRTPCHVNGTQYPANLSPRRGGQAEGLAGDRRSAIDSVRQPLPAVIGAISECESRADAHALERNGSGSNASRSPYCSRIRLAPALPHHSSSPLFQLRFMLVITAAPEKTCGVRGLLGGRATQRGGGRITI
jgi:hypothetical protein